MKPLTPARLFKPMMSHPQITFSSRLTMFKTGDLVLSGQPFGLCLYNEERLKRCDNCFSPLKTSVYCSKCKYVLYCSRDCQRDGFVFHEHECHLLSQRPLSTLTRLLGRIIHRCRSQDGNKYFDKVYGIERRWSDLMDHYDEVIFDAEAMFAFNRIFLDLEAIIGEELDVREIVKYYGKILVNSFAVQDELLQPIGRAVYLGVSIFDHSCLPNATFTFIGTNVFIKAIKPIETLSQVRISYLDELNPCHERMRQLFLHYYFICDCQRCNHPRFALLDPKIEAELSYIVEDLDFLYLDSVTVHRITRTPERQDRFTKLLNKFIEDEKEGRFLKVMARIEDVREKIVNSNDILAIKVCDFISEFEENVDLALRVIDFFRAFYGRFSPRLSVKLYLTARMPQIKPLLKQRLLLEAQKICAVFIPSSEQVLKEKLVMKENFEPIDLVPRGRSREARSVKTSDHLLPGLTLSNLVEKELKELQEQIQTKVAVSNHKAKWRSQSATRMLPFSSSSHSSKNRSLQSKPSLSIHSHSSSFKYLL